MKKFNYRNIDEYYSIQKSTSLNTKDRTELNGIYRDLFLTKTKELYTSPIKSIICLGARSQTEITHFINRGIKTIGIDLYDDNNIVNCDMAKIYQHPELKKTQYDAFVSIHSLEHCYNIEEFIQYNLQMCNIFYFVLPLNITPAEWDCVSFDFNNITKKEYNKDKQIKQVEDTFTQFKVDWIEYDFDGKYKNNNKMDATILCIMSKKKIM